MKKIKIKEETMKESKAVYKPLVETPEGKLVSIWAGSSLGSVLEYEEGEVTYAPRASAGIWVSPTEERAMSVGRGNKDKAGVLVVHKVTTLGRQLQPGQGLVHGSSSTLAKDVRYSAILLGKEVWRETPREPVWADVTAECVPKLSGNIVKLYHKETYVLGLGGKYAALTVNPDYSVRVDVDAGWFGEFRVFKKTEGG